VSEKTLNYKGKETLANEGAIRADNDMVPTSNLPPPPELAPHPDLLQRNALTFDPFPVLDDDDEYSVSAPDDQAELMQWHYHLGHASFTKLKQLARNGKIPTKLARVQPPRCPGCLFGAMTKVPWRTKEQQEHSHAVFAATKPGECVSVDHKQSTEPGSYGQAKGTLTKTRYPNATIFVNHFSHLKFVYLMTSNLTSAETVDVKRAFERFATEHRVRIQHYHCDNGRFADSIFCEACEAQSQKLTFCGVNAHFQNGIAK
jgi:hypothetical protein